MYVWLFNLQYSFSYQTQYSLQYCYILSSVHTYIIYIYVCITVSCSKKTKTHSQKCFVLPIMYYPAVFDLIAEVCSASFGLAETA